MSGKGERASKKARRLSTDSEGSEDQGEYNWAGSKSKSAPAAVDKKTKYVSPIP
ncbi:hypothetical protein GLAREA_03464 [Glarea lozoyensis ATCC 20868]|uniref:Uncharacterized protein n=1 Tax=Glarea lozoyensis (strain ATCC 20868 / MF5171) TaxID=1116229 RepID=S3CVQ5_GLAL2|nr:uncharacterized protein GLAREA_03464 [Glarea lozoyensis ATCC 20868]EPE30497.1 hypothetical protein GLAREA_03464 [Glarea lozoyensis ATCC 20868]